MNYYEHHLGDWLKKCNHLSMIEEGCYRRLLDWYYGHEKPLPADIKTLHRIARASNRGERAAVQRILAEFFTLVDDGWHQPRVDRELARYAEKRPTLSLNSAAQRLRNEAGRAYRSALYSVLRKAGVKPPWNARDSELLLLIEERGLTAPEPAPRTAPDDGTSTAPADGSCAHHQPPIGVLKENPENYVGAAVAIRKAGFAAVNASDPRLMALCEAGVTGQQLAVIGAEAAAQGKPWDWLLLTAKRRHTIQTPTPKQAQEGPKTFRQRAAEATVRAWAPQLLPNDPRAQNE